MANKSRIKIPLYQRWNHFRMGILPFLCFIGCVILTIALWERQAFRGSIVGEVEAIRTDVAVGVDGILKYPELMLTRDDQGNVISQKYWKLFDEVIAGQTIAVLDDKLINAEFAEVQAEIKQLNAEFIRVKAEMEVDIEQIQQQYIRDKYQREVDYEAAIGQKLALESQIAEDNKTLQQIDTQIQYYVSMQAKSSGPGNQQSEFSPVSKKQLVLRVQEATGISLDKLVPVFRKPLSQSFSERDLVRELDGREIVKERILKAQYQLEVQEVIVKRAKDRRKPFAPKDKRLPTVDQMLAGIREAQEAQAVRLETIRIKQQALTIKAPLDGVITYIWARPGQNVQAGDPVVTIAQRASNYIVSYWRESQKTRPTKDLKVGIRLAQPGGEEFSSQIADIGPQVELIPDHQLKVMGTPEYGLPVKCRIPDGMNVRPGELVHIIYREDGK